MEKFAHAAANNNEEEDGNDDKFYENKCIFE